MRMKGCLRRVGLGVAGLLGVLVVALAAWTINVNRQIAATEVNAPADAAPGVFLTVDGYDFHVELFGPEEDPSGAPLLLLHGFSVSGGREWMALAPLLAGERRLIAPDFLGLGFSQRVTQPTPAYTRAQRSQHLAQLLDALDVDQVDVVGSSFGGGMAAQFALDYPERVRRVVLLDAQVYEADIGFFRALGELPLGIGRAMTWTSLVGGRVAEMFLTGGCENGRYCPSAAELARWKAPTQVRGATDALRAISATPPQARIPEDIGQLDLPVLIIWGEEDTIIDPAEGRQLAQDIPGAELVFIPDAGHTPHLDRPQQVAGLVLRFLGDG